MIHYEGDAGFVRELDYVKAVRDYGREMEIELQNISHKNRLLKDLLPKIAVNGFQIREPSLGNIFIRKVNEANRGAQQ